MKNYTIFKINFQEKNLRKKYFFDKILLVRRNILCTKKDEYVVYRHDVCKIKDIRTNSLNGNTYYVMTPIDDESLIIDIPTENKLGHLRDIISSDKANELIKRISSINPIEEINDKKLDSKYKELLSSGTYDDLIKIIKTTYLRNKSRIANNRKISEKDNTYFKLAEKYLYNELAISLNMNPMEVKDYISKVVNNK